jgi:flagellin-like hook-associated protein FlgL
MSSVIGVPTTRVSDLFIRQRLLNQVQSDQLELFKLHTQMSTGHRISVPSEDADSALRIMSLQRLLERKEQVQTNLEVNQSYLTTTDTAVGTISNTLAEARGLALSVVGTTATNQQREAVAQQIGETIRQVVDAGNQKFRGRHLFAGSETATRPFHWTANNVIEYRGNDEKLSSYSDIDLVFDTNYTGNEVFGAISEPVRGSVDMNPVVTARTRLADLRGGEGITKGSLEISDGSTNKIIDLSAAETIGDVARMIKADPPDGNTVNVQITPRGLALQLESGDLTIKEVGGGTTASELGIRTDLGVGTSTVVSDDLDPIMRQTTTLENVLGSQAVATLFMSGGDNDICFEADEPGVDYNGITISLIDDGTVLVEGNEVATYDDALKTLTINVNSTLSRAKHVVDAVNNLADCPLTAALDPLEGDGAGDGPLDMAATAVTDFGSGTSLDQTSGLEIVNGEETHVIDISSAVTVEDLLNALNSSKAGVQAAINDDKTGLDVRSVLSGCDFKIGENGGTTATQLGLRTFTRDTELDDLNYGRGVDDWDGVGAAARASIEFPGQGNDLQIRARETGEEWNDFEIEFIDGVAPGSETLNYDEANKKITFGIASGVTTAAEIVDLFNATPDVREDFEILLESDDGKPNEGDGKVRSAVATTAGGANGDIDFVITRIDDTKLEIDMAGLRTVGDLLDAINNHPDNVGATPPLVARLATQGNGIELVDNYPGEGDVTVSRTPNSEAAVDLGLVPAGLESQTTTTNGSVATADATSPGANNDLIFRVRGSGTYYEDTEVIFFDNGLGAGNETFNWDESNRRLEFGIDPATTSANTIIALLDGDATASQIFSAELDLSDGAPNDGTGIVAEDTWLMQGGEPDLLTGTDVNPQEVDGVFTALLRLKDGLERNDVLAVQRAIDMLDDEVVDMHFARAELGAEQQGLDTLQYRLESEDVDLRSALSLEYDVDFTEVVSKLTAQQTSLEAGLRSTAQIFRMTLLSYL